jgi:signal peptidase II
MLFYLIIAAVTFLDQASKYLVRTHLKLGDSVLVWPHALTLTFTRYENSGAAGSSFQGYARVFVVVAVVMIAMVFYYRRKGQLRGCVIEIGTAFLVGGAAGNAIDRLLFNKVTDFIEFRSGHGVLNVADLAINIGVIFIILDFAIIPALKHAGNKIRV